jgi:AAA15 family ATPase/GTPase
VEIDLVIKNYRCFQKPARITLRRGFTAFVGVNNSGKSSLLKFFFEFRNLFAVLGGSPGALRDALKETSGPVNLIGVQDVKEVFNDSNTRNIEIELWFSVHSAVDQPVPSRLLITVFRDTLNWTAKLYCRNNSSSPTERLIQYNVPGDPSTQSLDFETPTRLIYRGNTRLDFGEIFPLLRAFANTLYIGPFRNIINVGTNEAYFDIKVGQSFIQNWRRLKSGQVKEQSAAIIKLTEDIERIFEYDRLEINPADDDTTLQLIINQKPYKLSELGSGIAQFIIVLANAALRRPAFILLDEPELNLHPSLQLDFLTTLASYASDGILYATHSIGLARSNAERIYSVRKIADGDSEVRDYEATPNLAQFVGELSFSSYQELGFNKILLVEGRSEVKAIQQFLRLWRKDHQIVLIPLGGGTLINRSSELELQELKRISTNVSALIDSERVFQDAPLAANVSAFVASCENLGINVSVLERRATENYFTDEAVKKVLGSAHRALAPYEKLNEVSPSWSKSENWRIAREMSIADLESTDLGAFLQLLCTDPSV